MGSHKNYQIIPIIVDDRSNLKTVNFYLVKTENSLILVDAGFNSEKCFLALEKALKENGWKLTDITEIILTHNHHDHVGLVNRITLVHPIPVYAHKNAIPRLKRYRKFLEMRVEFYKTLYREMGCGAAGDKRVKFLEQSIEKNSSKKLQPDITPIGKKHLLFDVIEVPGHAPDQIALYHKNDNILISGDLLIDHISSNALVEPDNDGNRMKTLQQHKQSLQKVRDFDLKRVYPGHSIIIEQPNELLDKRITGIEKKAMRIKKMIQDGLSTGDEMAQFFYKQNYKNQFSLVMSEIIGHLDYLEDRHEITKEINNGVWHYAVNS